MFFCDVLSYCACGERGFLSLVLPAVARFLSASMSAWCLQLRIRLTGLAACLYSRVFSPPQVAKVPGITGWDLHHGTYVGVACDNHAEVSGLEFADNTLWMSATTPAGVTLVLANSCDVIYV